MGMNREAALILVRDLRDKGELELDANVMIVRLIGVEIVTGSLPRDVRAAYNAAVKDGMLGHLKKDKSTGKPEAYFHPNSEATARSLRNRYASAGIEALRGVLVFNEVDATEK